jgi:predicted O-methyltransferase YrrM
MSSTDTALRSLLMAGGLLLVAGIVLSPLHGLVLGLLGGLGALGAGLTLAVRAIQREADVRYRRTEAWLAIYGVIRPRTALPAIQPYMATPELLRLALQLLLERRPALVVELGSGLSTVLMAYGLEQLGQGRIISVDHETRFCEATRALLASHGLVHRVRLVHAPLVPVTADGHAGNWYDPEELRAALEQEREAIGLLLVDGPPGKDQRLARLPAVPLLHDRLSPTAVVLVDDARRPDEQEMVRRWMAADPGFLREDVSTEKGAIILRRPG